MSSQRTGAVIVVYHPDEPRVARLAGTLLAQLDVLVVVDNTPGGSSVRAALPEAAHLLTLGRNTGIGEALNRGVEALREAGCTRFLLSDQDSEPAADMVAQLAEALSAVEREGRAVAAVGAAFVDPRTGISQGFPVVTAHRVAMVSEPDTSGYVPASFLITSGSLVSQASWDAIGAMEAGLFIDVVDMEWCFRASARGYASYGVPQAKMQHTIGDHTVSFWFLGRRCNPVHSPFRVYFQFRNYLALLARGYIPWRAKSWMTINRVVLAYMYLFIVRKQTGQYFKAIVRGLWHGLRGRRGGLA